MSNIPRKHRNSGLKLFFFDPITTERKPVDYDYLDGLLTIPSNQLSVYICKRKPLYQLGGFLCNENFTTKDLKELMCKWKTEEIEKEIWKYTDETKKYQVSNLGRARKMNKTTPPYFIIPYLNERTKGLYRIKISYKGVYKEVMLHQVVADLFLFNDDPTNKTHIIHKSGFKLDNRANNLEYVTRLEAASLGGGKVCVPVIRKEIGTGKVIGRFESLLDAERKTGIKFQNIRDCLTGRRPTMGRSTWELAEDDEDEQISLFM